MIFALAVDILLYALIAWAVLTQLVIPALRGSRLFPAFSKRTHDLTDELAEVEQEIVAEHVRHTLAQRKADLQHEKDNTIADLHI